MNDLHSQILQHVQEIIYVVKINGDPLRGKVEVVGKRVESLLGYKPQEFIENPNLWISIIHPDDLEGVRRTTQEMYETGKPVTRIYRVRHKTTGQYLWVEDKPSPLFDVNGKVVGYVGVAHDITERKQAEDAAHRWKHMLETLFESIPDALLVVDLDGRITQANKQAELMFGYNRDELLNLSVEALIPEEFRKAHIQHRADYTSSPRSRIMGASIELYAKRKDDTEFPVDVALGPIKFDGTTLILCAIRDVTERKHAEEQMRQLSMAVEQTADCVVITDREGVIQYVNAAFEKETGYTPEEALGKTPRILKSGEHDPRFFEVLWKTILAGNVFRAVFINSNKAGELFYEQKTITPLKDSKGNITHFVSTGKNITEQVQAENELRKSEHKFRNTWEGSLDGMRLVDETGKFTLVNDAFCRMVGKTKEELIGQSYDVIYADRNDTDRLEQRIALRNIEPHFEREIELWNHKKIWFELSNSYLEIAGQHAILFSIFRDITERKQAEEALQESEERFRHVFEESTDPILLLNQKYFFDCNLAALSILQLTSKDEIGNKTPWDLSPEFQPDGKLSSEKAVEMISTAKQNGYHRFEWVHTKKDGSNFFVEVMLTSIALHGEEIFHVVWRDITKRKFAEQEREVLYAIGETVNTTASLDELLQSIHHNIKKVMYAENCYVALYDAGTETISFPLFVDQFDPTPAPSAKRRGLTEYVLRTANQLLLTPELLDELVRNNEVEIIGTPPESWLGVPLFIQSKPIGVLVVQSYEPGQKYADREKDMLVAIGNQAAAAIERKRAQEDLQRSLSLLTATLESTADGILVVDTEGKIVSFNQKFVDMWRIPDSVIASRDDNQALSFVLDQLKYPEGFLKKVRELYAEPEVESYDMLGFKDGRIFERYSQPQWVSGKTVGRVWSFRDITEQRKLEAQFLQTQKLEGLGTLAGGIAHDFNNILGIIMGHSSLLERFKADPQKLSQSVEAITKATQRGASLVKQLLTFARKTETLFESVSINNMISEINKLIQETFPKTITISTSLQQDLPAIVADATQIHQVLLNLCVNARDAMPKRGTLSISTSAIEGEPLRSRFPKATARQYVRIEVADTGIGMDEATRQRIFEPFFTTKDIGKGTGLGLALVFSIVGNHNGFIDVQSKLDEGTTFTIYLPISERTPEVSQPTRQAVEEIPGGTETILVIEDEEMLRNLVKAVLVSKGYTVLTAEDGMQGVEMYQSHQDQIAIVLSDVGLPALSGQDVLKRIREMNPKAKVILASGFIDPETKSEMYKAGLKNFIQKPYLPDEVLQKIREVIDTDQ